MENALFGTFLTIGLAITSTALADPPQATFSFAGGDFANAQVEAQMADGVVVQLGLNGFELLSLQSDASTFMRDVAVSYTELDANGEFLSMGWGMADIAPDINMNAATLHFAVNVQDYLDGAPVAERTVSGAVVLRAASKPYWGRKELTTSCGDGIVEVFHALGMMRDAVVVDAEVDGASLAVSHCYECVLGWAYDASLTFAKR